MTNRQRSIILIVGIPIALLALVPLMLDYPKNTLIVAALFVFVLLPVIVLKQFALRYMYDKILESEKRAAVHSPAAMKELEQDKACPMCGAAIRPKSTKCAQCGETIAKPKDPLTGKSRLIGALLVAGFLVWCCVSVAIILPVVDGWLSQHFGISAWRLLAAAFVFIPMLFMALLYELKFKETQSEARTRKGLSLLPVNPLPPDPDATPDSNGPTRRVTVFGIQPDSHKRKGDLTSEPRR
jgi:hypothetical protein